MGEDAVTWSLLLVLVVASHDDSFLVTPEHCYLKRGVPSSAWFRTLRVPQPRIQTRFRLVVMRVGLDAQCGDELLVQAVSVKEFMMGAGIAYPAVFEHENLMGVEHRG